MKGILFAFILSLSVQAQAYDYPQLQDFVYTIQDGQITGRGVFNDASPTIDSIERDRYQFNNYPEFLDYLFKQQPRLKDRFVLLHHSGSLQLASVEHPRIIAFGGGAAFAFSEHPANRQMRVEMLEVSPVDYRIKMSELVFNDDGIQIHRDPSACTACHGAPAKMLWDPYDFWPQAFAGAVGLQATKGEKDAYQALRARASQSEALKHLNVPENLTLGSEANTAFTQFVGQVNLASWSLLNLKNQTLDGWRWPLLWVLNACEGGGSVGLNFSVLDHWLRADEVPPVRERLQHIYADTVLAREHFKSFQDALAFDAFDYGQRIYKIDHSRLIRENADVALIRTIFDFAGIDASNLSTSPFANDSFFSNPSHFLLDFQTVLLETKPQWFTDLEITGLALTGPGKDTHVRLNCAELEAHSLTAARDLSRASQWSSYATVKYNRPVVNRCAHCHSEGLNAAAPPIPFTDSLKLSHWLRNPRIRGGDKIRDRITRAGTGRMPPGHPLSVTEISSMNAFLKILE